MRISQVILFYHRNKSSGLFYFLSFTVGTAKSRSFRYPGQPNHPWQGQSQHRAATHKVHLNRNFKYTFPILADRNLEA